MTSFDDHTRQDSAQAESESRFAFGENWRRFLETIDEERICEAERSIIALLEVNSLQGKRFLDVGSGSGLFSLAARRLGAHVTSFDLDQDSVRCTAELRRRYYPGDDSWRVEAGSVLDGGFLRDKGLFDVVYAWGVLHHTGAMWRALDSVCGLVAPKGILYVSIYNDQGGHSRRWLAIKRLYNRSSRLPRFLLILAIGFYQEVRVSFSRLVRLRSPFSRERSRRGMSRWHNLVDWVGGYPFEVAKPEEIFQFCRNKGFCLTQLRTMGGGLGCNEYVFRRSAASE